ncbi:EAL domain-containing protein [Bradyrhizobium viridifuturi]|nr:EAL domain-containing protein [Bradyrhizobium sp.]ERF80013.1 MAG: diguanylate cyclase (GGDEF) domain-containing protein [Bradyrhizobium sp. DFCI-1]MBR1025194.1 EAL domain-containing protein [Bradyrhizobium viridifuturi]OYU58518.1 MAG: GGDEF-domain containing protein [Bradyrhizobium sp. PARBB1]PSO15108.1 GGDEF-domain containing protein [Bradyrhizobium sp. MOS004]QRI73125.1 EAL domain-containing protein [Bradyrhizobium sp. PSBB068]
MVVRKGLSAAVGLLSVDSGKPGLLRAQLAALSRLVPLLYFILVANAWVVSSNFIGKAPDWLTLGVALLLSVVCCVRLVVWWRKRELALTDERALRELRRTNLLAAILGLAFAAWGFALFPYGDAYEQAFVGLFETIVMLSSMVCLIHSRSAAVTVALTVSLPFVVFFASTGVPVFVSMAVNFTLVTVAIVIVISIQYRDFTRMVEAQARAELLGNENLRLANLDSLTDLPNRRAFFSRIGDVLQDASSDQSRVALAIIDLDGFKPVNDLYGHAVGDRLLIEVARRLSDQCASDRDVFLARLGGDEFAYVVANAPKDEALVAQADQLAQSLRLPFVLPEATVKISGSIGIGVYPEMASSVEQLFERADYALYHGKGAKRGEAVLFSSSHEAQINRDARIEQALKLADFDEELTVLFQPIVDIRSQATVGFEALARWTSPILGKIPPAQFIPVAERAGIIDLLTKPLLRKALAAAARWSSDIRLSFNLSAHDLNSSRNTLAIVSIIRNSGFPPNRIDLEITETAFTHDFEEVRNSVELLRLLGCGISLDDFGTGYSSLSRLHALPLTKIKIDRSFVTNLNENPASYKIVKSLLALSRDMGLDCVIEGVETQQELDVLKELGRLTVQGYFYSPPIAEADVLGFLRRNVSVDPSRQAEGV